MICTEYPQRLAMKNSKRHTKPCVYFQTDSCPLSSEDCDYSHVIASPEQLEALRTPQATLRTKPCRFYLAGQCKDGFWCRFKHPAELSTTPRSPSEGSEEAGSVNSWEGSDSVMDIRDLDSSLKAKPEQHPKYRTRPCRNFLLGKCIYGHRCSYLHAASTPPVLDSPASYCPATPPPTALFPLTPPPQHVPLASPVDSRSAISDGNRDAALMDVDAALVASIVPNFVAGCRTPSTGSSLATDEVQTPATPRGGPFSPISSGLPAFPLAPPPYLDRIHKRNPAVPPPTPPYGLLSPMSSVPMTIVHVPIAVPMYRLSQDDIARASSVGTEHERYSRPRSFSQPLMGTGTFSPRSSFFKTKPCRFYNETGRCSKGERCNFIHAERPLSPNCQSHGDTRALGDEAGREMGKNEASPKPVVCRSDGIPNNFHRVNWRILGGGVMMGSNSGMLRRYSEDTSTRSHGKLSFRNPFTSHTDERSYLCARSAQGATERSCIPEAPSPLSLGAPIDLNGRANSLPTTTNTAHVQAMTATEKKNINALALTLKSYNLSAANRTDSSNRPIIVVQGENDAGAPRERLDWGDDYGEDDIVTHLKGHGLAQAGSRLVAPSLALRSKSSPSSPVGAQFDVPVRFSAESP